MVATEENTWVENNEIDTQNIFDEFQEEDNSINTEESLPEVKKDIFYYISKAWKIFQVLFWLLFLWALIMYSYIYAQNNTELSNSSILDPICKVFLWDLPKDSPFPADLNIVNNSLCSSVSSIRQEYSSGLNELKVQQAEKILEILDTVYTSENFTKTKGVLFLLNKSKNKVPVIDMIDSFDTLKRNFDTIEKQKIQCMDIEIYNSNILSLKCEAYSAGYERWIRWFDGTTWQALWGTSISIANSFLNYISKESTNFTLLNRQKVFSSESVVWDTSGFTHKTVFDIQLEYTPNTLWS